MPPKPTPKEASVAGIYDPQRHVYDSLRRSARGRPEPSHYNAYVILTQDTRWKDAIWHSSTDRQVYIQVPGDHVRPLGESATAAVRLWLETVYELQVRLSSSLHPTIRLIAEDNQRQDYTMPVDSYDLSRFWDVHPWWDLIKAWVDVQQDPFTMKTLCRMVFNSDVTTHQAGNIAQILRRLDYHNYRRVTPENPRAVVWWREPLPYLGRGRPRKKIESKRKVNRFPPTS